MKFSILLMSVEKPFFHLPEAAQIVFCFFLIFAAITLVVFSLLKSKNKTLSKSRLIVSASESVLLISFGITLLFYDNFTEFGILHLMLSAICITGAFSLNSYIKTVRTKKIVLAVFSAVFFLMALIKISYPYSAYKMLPLNICNIAAVFIMIRPFCKNTYFDNYILCFGLLEAVMNTVIGADYNLSFFSFPLFESNIVHNLYYTYCIFVFISREIVPDKKKAIKNMAWLVVVFCVFVFTNQIYEFNFFFTSKFENPILAIYNIFPFFNLILAGFVFEINILYYLVVISVALLCLFLLTLLFEKLEKVLIKHEIKKKD